MAIASSDLELQRVLDAAVDVSPAHPVVMTEFIRGAREVELDGVAANGKILTAALSEHVEDAGTHSGDATLICPPSDSLSAYYQAQVRNQAREIAHALAISGPFNVQFLAKGPQVLVIECNLRASRSCPFVSKTTGVDLIQVATKVMMNVVVQNNDLLSFQPRQSSSSSPRHFVGLKFPMFSYTRLANADPLVGVEMASTGEVACFGKDKYEAILKAMLSSGMKLPERNILISFEIQEFGHVFIHLAHQLVSMGYRLYTTQKTFEFLTTTHGIPSMQLDFPLDPILTEKASSHALEYLQNHKIDLVINLPGCASTQLENNYLLRRTAVDFSIPLLTNIQLVKVFVDALERHRHQPLLGLEPDSLFDYYDRENHDQQAWSGPHEFHW